MKYFLIFVCLLVCVACQDESKLTTVEFVESYGYPAETHEVQTSDGYILVMHRIPYGKKCSADKSKGPVLLMHGILSSSMDWVILGPEKSLGFLLADRCYDVWLGNNRGNTYSRGHVSLPVTGSDYWQFSWHELGEFDTPVLIDYVLHKSGKEKLIYAGHSQGTTQFWIFNSLYPEYSSKVKAMFALAPIAYLGHSNSFVLQTISLFQAEINWITSFIGLNEFLPSDGFISMVGNAACKDDFPGLEAICSNILFIACGYDKEQMNMTALPHIMAHVPAGSSTKQLLHYAQSFNSNKFRWFDHGLIKNLLIYGQPEPPAYDLSKNTIPVTLFFSANDWLANVKDVDLLKGNLANIVDQYFVPFEHFNHLDYLYATDLDTLVNLPLIDKMDKL